MSEHAQEQLAQLAAELNEAWATSAFMDAEVTPVPASPDITLAGQQREAEAAQTRPEAEAS
jgi:hypothetical protein